MTPTHSAAQTLSAHRALWLGIAFSVGFAALTAALDPLLPTIAFAPDTGASHYYWQLPDPTFWTRLLVWTCYAGHQLTIWGIVWYAIHRSGIDRRSSALHGFNIAALAANALFVLLHLAQTHITYDGLAQDVSIWSSQGSVVLLLVVVVLMENQRRGLVLGQRLSMLAASGQFFRRYHGYLFSWAVVYTFWYHPMVGTLGHVLGTAYTALIMLQGSLFLTRVHTNKWWTLALETLVVVHGTLVAVMQGNGLWPMFLFGFAAVFVLTQMHGLGLSRRTRWLFVIAYLAGVALVYTIVRPWTNVHEVLRIPLVDYALVFAVAGIVFVCSLLAKIAGRSTAAR
ncbi:MAG: hypothetical protein FJX64_06565 [Alphaproteobacteria bacterium]|nr:hypothetical protein [Alphaproteobacteria bacterium]